MPHEPELDEPVGARWRPAGFLLALPSLAVFVGVGFIPLALPEFAGKIVHLEDQLAEVVYDRPGDDLLVRGFYVDLPPYGHHLFKVTRESTAHRRRSGLRLGGRSDQPSGASSSRA